MTAYFDRTATELGKLRDELGLIGDDRAYGAGLPDRLDKIERAVVLDVTLCAEWIGCPEDIRDAIHELVLRYAPSAQPPGIHGPEYDDLDKHIDGISRLAWDLHTVFHDLGSRGLNIFSDDPRSPVFALFGAGEARRERMRPPALGFWKNQIADLTAEERGPIVEMIAEQASAYAMRQHPGDHTKAEKARAEAISALVVTQ